MISLEQINGEIAVLEEEKPTHVIMQKLANLYVVRDHMAIGETVHEHPNVSTISSNSEFAELVRSKDFKASFAILDELMDALSVVEPKLYNSVIEKLKNTAGI